MTLESSKFREFLNFHEGIIEQNLIISIYDKYSSYDVTIKFLSHE